jgi:hypothetical protein
MTLEFNDKQVLHLAKLLYRCMEDVGSTKAVLYLTAPGAHLFQLVSHYGWLRAAPPPRQLDPADPLVLMAQRQRRSFALNQGADYPELLAFSQGRQDPHFFITPIYDHGEWIGLLIQRDLNRGGDYQLELHEGRTQAICEGIVAALRSFTARTEELAPAAPAAPAPPPPQPAPAVELGPIRLPAPPTFPEQRTFFWECAQMICRVVPAASAVALWVGDPAEGRPLLAYSRKPLSAPLEQQVLALACAQLASLRHHEFGILTKSESVDREPMQGPFRTLLPILLEVAVGEPDLLMVFRVEDAPFLAQEQEYIRSIARIMGLYLAEGRLHERYHQAFLSVSHRILASAGERIPHIKAQSLNTAELARSLARRLELTSAQVEAVTISAILHDVGTLLLDRRILDKPVLTGEDLEKVHQHPVLASTFLKDFRFPFDILRIIRHHHERWDGKGYPDGIAGETIPIESRIIHLVESFQVMTTGSSYKPAKPVPMALEEIRQLSGSHFDPHLAKEFMQMVELRQPIPAPGKTGAVARTL